MNTKKFQLKNGLTVLLEESHKAPVVSVQMWVRTGSADEKIGEEGISHFIEHLVFKGTRKFKVGEIASVIEGSGGELNAYTSFDQTVFYVTISKQFVDTGLLAIAEMMGFPLFDSQEIDNEREVVIEEIKRGQDSLGRRASQLMFSTAYTKHPYGIPVIGYEKNIREVTPAVLKNYFKVRYSPRNMFLVISGDFKSTEMKKTVSKLYGEFQDNRIRKSTRPKEPVQKTYKVAVEKADFEQSVGYLAWKVPDLMHKDTPALDLLAMLLGQGDTSRLTKKLRIEEPLANSIGASLFAPQDPGLFTISFGYQKENLKAILEKLTQTLKEFFENPIEPSEIERALINLDSEKFYAVETVDGMARSTGSQWFSAKDLHFQEKYMKAVAKVGPEELFKIAKKYLKPENMIVSAISNESQEAVEQVLKSWAENFSQWFKQIKSKASIKNKKIKIKNLQSKLGNTTGKIEKIKLKNGTTVLFCPSKETHLISVKAAFLGGLRQESEELSGVTELLARTWATQTKNRTESEIYEQSENMATQVQSLAGRNSIGLGLDFLNPFEKEAASLFFDILTAPTFSDEIIEREKIIQIRDIRTKKDSPSSMVGRDFMKTMFENHPYGRDLLGNEKSLEKITCTEIRAHWKKIANRKNLTIIVAGQFKKAQWLKWIEKYTTDLGSAAALKEHMKIGNLLRDQTTFTQSAKEQSHVMYGFRGLTITDPERYILQIIQSILAGQGGRLFLELRDKNSLAYSVSPVRLEGLETGYFGAYIGCSPDKVAKAIRMMREQFDLLVNEKVPTDELVRAQRYLVGRHDIDLQRISSIASSVLYDDIYGVDYKESFQISKRYFSITAEDIQKLAKKIFSSKSVISVVGPQDPWVSY